jgi:hypothetical protein
MYDIDPFPLTRWSETAISVLSIWQKEEAIARIDIHSSQWD